MREIISRGVAQIAGGLYVTLVLLTDGTVYGFNIHNSLVKIPEEVTNAIQISCGDHHAYALFNDGRTPFGWSYRGSDSSETITPEAANTAIQIVCGSNYTLALLSDKRVIGWGVDIFGQHVLTIPDTIQGHVKQLVCGAYTMALLDDGSVVYWGVHSIPGKTFPVFNTTEEIIQITKGDYNTFGITTSGRVIGRTIWNSDIIYNDIIEIPKDITVRQIVGCDDHFYIVYSDGTITYRCLRPEYCTTLDQYYDSAITYRGIHRDSSIHRDVVSKRHITVRQLIYTMGTILVLSDDGSVFDLGEVASQQTYKIIALRRDQGLLHLESIPQAPQPTGEICTLCDNTKTYSGVFTGEVVTRLKCGHTFHKMCIGRQFREELYICNDCKAPIDVDEYRKDIEAGKVLLGGDKNYYAKYLKYKHKYLKLKY